jgi:DNA repair exonuclease SbcCD ATPase subunit
VLKEKVVKKRQQVTGYTSLYWIDEVPRMEKEFKAEIESIMPEQQFRVLTNPMYFNETMTWQERRAILLQLAGDVGCPDGFTALLEELGSRTIREFKKVLSERKKKYNEERENIPPRIDELRKNQPEVAEDTAELDTRREQVKKSQEDIATAFSSLAERETQRTMAVERVNELTAERGKRAAALAADTSAVDGLIQEKQDLRSSLGELEAKVSVAGAKAKNSERDVVREKEDIELLAKRRATIQETLAKAEKQEIADICFNCGQKYPEDKLATAEEDKAKSVAEAQKAGQDVKAKLEAAQAELAELNQALATAKEELATAEHTRDKTQSEIEAKEHELDAKIAASPKPKPEEDKQWQELTAQIERAQELVGPSLADERASLGSRQHAAQNALAEVDKLLAGADRAKQDRERIAELEQRETELGALIAQTEGEIAQCEDYTAAESKLLVEAVNDKFEHTTWKLFKEHLSGGQDDCCVAVYEANGVAREWPDCSTGEKRLVGLDCCNVLMAHYGIAAPIWIDHSESITMALETRSQTIALEAVSGLDHLDVHVSA